MFCIVKSDVRQNQLLTVSCNLYRRINHKINSKQCCWYCMDISLNPSTTTTILHQLQYHMVDSKWQGHYQAQYRAAKTYASKSLTTAETRYANIEREMLAVSCISITFHHYLYGRKFVCQSDHKPLEDIHLKYLSDAPPKLQRLLLKL